jgi:ribose-phosphate pyrophosphokinase
MMLVGDVEGRTAILIDDLADTCITISRAAKLLKREGATKVIALVTHGIFSGDATDRLRGRDLDKIVVTNSVDQTEHQELLGDKLEVLEIANVFAEVSDVPMTRVLMMVILMEVFRLFDECIMERV